MTKTLQLQSIEKAKGRPLLQWVGKKPLEKIEYYPAQEKEVYGNPNAKESNKLFWGDNLQVLSHLVKDYRGKIDLIYIDPPFDSKAEYVKKVKIKGETIEGEPQSLLEDKQYKDIWAKDEYLQYMYERFLIMRELLSDKGSIYVHLDFNKVHYLKAVLDEVFGEENFQREIIWRIGWTSGYKTATKNWIRNHDTILYYTKNKNNFTFNKEYIPYPKDYIRRDGSKPEGAGYPIEDTWNCNDLDRMDSIQIMSFSGEKRDYPTQKNENLVARIIRASSREGDVVADFFVGSGTTLAVAQMLGRRWVGCDINQGAIQTTTKRLNRIIEEQIARTAKGKGRLKISDDIKFKFPNGQTHILQKNIRMLENPILAFKVYNVNDYEIFKNELEAKEIIAETYGIEPVKRSYFDGILDNNYVKIMPLNRVLNKLDIKLVLKATEDKLSDFSVKAKSKSGEPVYEQGVIIICSGAEVDVYDFLKKENKTGVQIEIRDILTDKKNLIFKEKPEAKITIKATNKKLNVSLKEFHSPILMRKLEIENEKALKKDDQAQVNDFKQIIDSVAIDVDYNGKLFNAEIIDLPNKKELIKADYRWKYNKKGSYKVAVKIIDVLGEEYFETFEIEV